MSKRTQYVYLVDVKLQDESLRHVVCMSIREVIDLLKISADTVFKLVRKQKTIYDTKYTVSRVPKKDYTFPKLVPGFHETPVVEDQVTPVAEG